MGKMRKVRLGGCLLALLLAGCAPPGLNPPKLATPDAHSKWDYQTAVNACTDEALHKTTSSVLTILSRLRPGAYTTAYVACMKGKGYDVH
jgi:hypothetical protein